jgi:ribonuclease I
MRNYIALKLLVLIIPFFVISCTTVHQDKINNDLVLHVPQHANFEHYTLALTWQPGFCTGKRGMDCQKDQPRDTLIGLHGLWASRPADLVRDDLPANLWWQKGCAIYQPDETARLPVLSGALQKRLDSLVAHTRFNLVTHEYAKHVSCFATNPENFFSVAISLRDRFAQLKSAHFIESNIGKIIDKSMFLEKITDDVGPLPERSVQFQCTNTPSGVGVLSQIWFTISPEKISMFPKNTSLKINAYKQDNCPNAFLVPSWPT